MSEMVERVRKAIEAHCCEVGFQLTPAAGNLLARAAIEAMRQPTDAMIAVGQNRPTHTIENSHASTLVRWILMIDAALGEGE